MEELLDDPRYATNESRGENYDTSLRKIIADKFKDMTKWEIENLLRPYNIPSGPGYTVPEAFESEQLNSRNMVVEVEDKQIGKIRMPGSPIKISGIGYTEEQIAGLMEENIVMCEGGRK